MSRFLEQLSLVLTFAGIAQGIFVVLLLNSRGVRRSRANFFLSILLVALSFSIMHILFAGAVVNHFEGKVYSLGDPTFFLIAPLLWFYTKELTGQRVSRLWRLNFHFIPFYLIIVFSLSLRSIHVNSFILFLDQHHRLLTVFFWLTVVIQFSWYQYFIQKRWIVYRDFLQHEVSNTENVSISWVRFFMGVFVVINLLFLFSLLVAIHVESQQWLARSIALIFSLSIFALGYKGILQREVFHTYIKERPDEDAIAPKLEIAEIKPDQNLIDRLRHYVVEKKPYLDPELTLSILAKNLNISRSQLSQLINEGVGDNFYDFINKYRVDEVKKLMVDPQVKNYNLLGIALEAGFKSKSTFNLIFKRFTGLTPTEYRKNISR